MSVEIIEGTHPYLHPLIVSSYGEPVLVDHRIDPVFKDYIEPFPSTGLLHVLKSVSTQSHNSDNEDGLVYFQTEYLGSTFKGVYIAPPPWETILDSATVVMSNGDTTYAVNVQRLPSEILSLPIDINRYPLAAVMYAASAKFRSQLIYANIHKVNYYILALWRLIRQNRDNWYEIHIQDSALSKLYTAMLNDILFNADDDGLNMLLITAMPNITPELKSLLDAHLTYVERTSQSGVHDHVIQRLGYYLTRNLYPDEEMMLW